MKKAPFIVLLVLTFIAEALACYLMLSKIKDIKTDSVKVNECMYSISENYGDTSKYNTQLDYVVIDNDGKLVYKTRDGLSESVNEAIKTRGLIIDLTVDVFAYTTYLALSSIGVSLETVPSASARF